MARILLYDLETTPLLGYSWGLWEQNILEVVEYPYILCIAYKWLGDKDTKVKSLWDFPNYKKNKKNDRALVKVLHSLLDEADIVVGQNSNQFDNKWANKQFLKHGLKPVSPYQAVDTKLIARKHFRFESNSLDYMAKFLGIGSKVKHEGKDLWFAVMNGDPAACKRMVKYARNDVVLTEALYNKVKPFMDNHPNMNMYSESERPICPACKSTRLQKRGYQIKGRWSKAARYQCQSCGKWSQGRTTTNKEIQIS